MPKDHDYIPSPFSPDLNAIMRDNQKSTSSISQGGDNSGRDLKPSAAMDAGIPTDSLEESDA